MEAELPKAFLVWREPGPYTMTTLHLWNKEHGSLNSSQMLLIIVFFLVRGVKSWQGKAGREINVAKEQICYALQYLEFRARMQIREKRVKLKVCVEWWDGNCCWVNIWPPCRAHKLAFVTVNAWQINWRKLAVDVDIFHVTLQWA